MIALVTVAVFIYRKPFSHLFSAVGYGTIGSTERAEYSLREASHTFRRSTLDAATAAVPGVASYRAARWARRNPGPAAAVAAGAAAGVAAGSATAGRATAVVAHRGPDGRERGGNGPAWYGQGGRRRGGYRRRPGRDRRRLRVAAPAGRAAPGRRGRRGGLGLPPGRLWC